MKFQFKKLKYEQHIPKQLIHEYTDRRLNTSPHTLSNMLKQSQNKSPRTLSNMLSLIKNCKAHDFNFKNPEAVNTLIEAVLELVSDVPNYFV